MVIGLTYHYVIANLLLFEKSGLSLHCFVAHKTNVCMELFKLRMVKQAKPILIWIGKRKVLFRSIGQIYLNIENVSCEKNTTENFRQQILIWLVAKIFIIILSWSQVFRANSDEIRLQLRNWKIIHLFQLSLLNLKLFCSFEFASSTFSCTVLSSTVLFREKLTCLDISIGIWYVPCGWK